MLQDELDRGALRVRALERLVQAPGAGLLRRRTSRSESVPSSARRASAAASIAPVPLPSLPALWAAAVQRSTLQVATVVAAIMPPISAMEGIGTAALCRCPEMPAPRRDYLILALNRLATSAAALRTAPAW